MNKTKKRKEKKKNTPENEWNKVFCTTYYAAGSPQAPFIRCSLPAGREKKLIGENRNFKYP